jgi:hypothetical protein
MLFAGCAPLPITFFGTEHCRGVRVLDFDPARTPAGLIAPIPMLRNNPFQAHPASLFEQAKSDRAGVMVVVNDAITRALQQLAEPQLADLQRLVSHVDAVVPQKIEGVQPDLFVAPSTVQAFEIPSGPSNRGRAEARLLEVITDVWLRRDHRVEIIAQRYARKSTHATLRRRSRRQGESVAIAFVRARLSDV